jgi:pimeloyl-ACP methyl ester carboxylesterase
MHLYRHCTAAILALIAGGAPVSRQSQAVLPAVGEANFTLFVRGTEVGGVHINLSNVGANWQITATGRFTDITLNRFELTYTADWQPVDLRVEAAQAGRSFGLATSFGVTTAISEITQNGTTTAKTDQISARTVVLPNNFWAGYEALAARLAALQAGAELPIYVAPQGEVKLTVGAVTAGSLQTPSGLVATRRFDVTIHNVGADLSAEVTIDSRSRLARLEIPAAAITMVRSDLAGISVRPATARNPTDVDVTIPAAGFNIAGTLTAPHAMGRLRLPAVVLVSGSGPVDRDETVAGIPIFAQLAGALAQNGFMVLRYDKRGVGQSGGRSETATLQDYADDLKGIVKWLARRSDVDRRRISAAGFSEGGAVAMLAASDDERIASLMLIAAPGTSGAELILEQQRHLLDTLKLPEPEREAKIALQKQIQTAVMTEKGVDALPADIRKQVDTPWFRSLLLFDPARVMRRVDQPILIVQGDLDKQVFPWHAGKLAELARARKKKTDVQVEHLPGINHLLVRAETGEASEYSSLKEKTIAPEVPTVIATWLRK